MAHFSLAPELFDKRADVTRNVRRYGIPGGFFYRLCGVIVQFKSRFNEWEMEILAIFT